MVRRRQLIRKRAIAICVVALLWTCAGARETTREPLANARITSLRFYYWRDPTGGCDPCAYGKGVRTELTGWSVGGGAAPRKFDIVVTLLNEDASREAATVVDVWRRYRVGPFVADPETEMTDYERGHREAKWTRYARIVAQSITLKPQQTKCVVIPVDFGRIYERYLKRDRWPWLLEVKASADHGRPVTRKLELQPGD